MERGKEATKMKLEDFNKMSEEERKEWLGDKELRFKRIKGKYHVWRYTPNRTLTEGEKKNRERFAEHAQEYALKFHKNRIKEDN